MHRVHIPSATKQSKVIKVNMLRIDTTNTKEYFKEFRTCSSVLDLVLWKATTENAWAILVPTSRIRTPMITK